MIKLDELFVLEYGQHEYSSKGDLKLGDTILISSQSLNNGCYGFFDIEPKYKSPIITVPRTGSIGEAFVQTKECCVDDNCLVLIPKNKLELPYFYYIAVMIREQKWRYLYGRQITPSRIGRLLISEPENFTINISYNEVKNEVISELNNIDF